MRRCVICGCSQLAACVTDDGPCHWVAAGMCSACVGAVCEIWDPAALAAGQLVYQPGATYVPGEA